MDYLHNKGQYADVSQYPKPGLIILDLNMPKKDGREALKIIKGDNTLKSIPTVILTTSKAEDDVTNTYDLGVNSFICKPLSFIGLVDIILTLGKYWFDVVELPPHSPSV